MEAGPPFIDEPCRGSRSGHDDVAGALASLGVEVIDGWDEGYRRWGASRVHAELIGEGLPALVQPFSFVPLDGLQMLDTLLAVLPDQTVVDLGCGRGGPGLWLASRSGGRLTGVDSSAVAIADAHHRRRLFPEAAARFQRADATDTGLPAGCADAVVTIDVLQLLEEPAALLREAARLLRPYGRLAATTWEGCGDAPARFPRDLPALVEGAGLRLHSYIERPDWLQRQLRIYRRAEAFTTEVPHDPALSDLAEEGRRWHAWHQDVRRVVAAAHRSE